MNENRYVLRTSADRNAAVEQRKFTEKEPQENNYPWCRPLSCVQPQRPTSPMPVSVNSYYRSSPRRQEMSKSKNLARTRFQPYPPMVECDLLSSQKDELDKIPQSTTPGLHYCLQKTRSPDHISKVRAWIARITTYCRLARRHLVGFLATKHRARLWAHYS